MIEQHTLLDTLIERRNEYQRRLVENMVNVVYFQKRTKKLKANTQERVDAQNAYAEAQKNVSQDKMLMESFDEVIEQVKKQEGSK